jgi:hypothetical protein
MRLSSRRQFLTFAAASVAAAQMPNKNEGHMPELRLQSRIERDASALVLHYSIENQTVRDAYLLNRVQDQSLQTTPDIIYIGFDRQRRLIRASKEVPGIPPGMSPTMPLSPYVTPLRAKQTFQEIVRISLPVREYKAYRDVPETGRIVPYVGLLFVMGFYWSVPGMKERTQQIIPGVEVLIPTPPPGAQIEFGELSSAVMALDFPVLETT